VVVHLTRHGFTDTILGSELVKRTTTAHSLVAVVSHTMGWSRENLMSVLKPSVRVSGQSEGLEQVCETFIR
jgi:hypothetical protein